LKKLKDNLGDIHEIITFSYPITPGCYSWAEANNPFLIFPEEPVTDDGKEEALS